MQNPTMERQLLRRHALYLPGPRTSQALDPFRMPINILFCRRRAPVVDAVPDSEDGEEFDLESVDVPTDTETEGGTPAPSPTPKMKRGG